MASEADKIELNHKVKTLVLTTYGGDYKKTFDFYDASVQKDGKIDAEELEKLLEAAKVGNWATRGTWATEIITELDGDKDKKISWMEFEAKLRTGK